MAESRCRTRDELRIRLVKSGKSWDEFRSELEERARSYTRFNLLRDRLIALTFEVSDEDLRKQFDRMYGPKLEARQIVVESRADAERVAAKLRQGADFAAVAKDESVHRASAAKGGRMELFGEDDIVRIVVRSSGHQGFKAKFHRLLVEGITRRPRQAPGLGT